MGHLNPKNTPDEEKTMRKMTKNLQSMALLGLFVSIGCAPASGRISSFDEEGLETSDTDGADDPDPDPDPDPEPEPMLDVAPDPDMGSPNVWVEDEVVYVRANVASGVVALEPAAAELLVGFWPDTRAAVDVLDADGEVLYRVQSQLLAVPTGEGAMGEASTQPCQKAMCWSEDLGTSANALTWTTSVEESSLALEGTIDGISFGFVGLVTDDEVTEATPLGGQLDEDQTLRVELLAEILDQTGALADEAEEAVPVCQSCCKAGYGLLAGGGIIAAGACCAAGGGVSGGAACVLCGGAAWEGASAWWDCAWDSECCGG